MERNYVTFTVCIENMLQRTFGSWDIDVEVETFFTLALEERPQPLNVVVPGTTKLTKKTMQNTSKPTQTQMILTGGVIQCIWPFITPPVKICMCWSGGLLRGVFRQFRRTRDDHTERLRTFLVLDLLSSLQQTTKMRPASLQKHRIDLDQIRKSKVKGHRTKRSSLGSANARASG